MRTSAALLLLTIGGAALSGPAAWAQDAPAAVTPAGAIQITQPYNKAVVRESVPIKLRDFPPGGYVSISIDGKFITAQALPKSRSLPVYVWDTKATYTDPDQPDAPKTYSDGAHAITIAVYNAQNKLVGQDTVAVQVADKINLPASSGIRIAYPWKTGLTLRYQRRTTLTAAPTDTSASASTQVLQQSLLRYSRSVENVSGGTALIRDEIISVDKSVRPKAFVSYVATRGQSQALGSGTHAQYREVDSRGRVLSKLTAQNTAESVGFSIPVLPPRRISVGAHWESPVQITLDWTSPTPATVTATSTLVDFEWQDRYPTAKIRESYEGPATFYPSAGSVLPTLASREIKFERLIYYAYNAGRVVRTQTTISLVSNDPGLLTASPGIGPGGFGGPGGPGGFGRPRGGFPGGPPAGFGAPPPGYSGPPPGFMPPPGFGGPPPGFGGPPDGYPGGPPPGYQGGPPAGYPGGPPAGYPGGPSGAAGQNGSPVKVTYTETSVLLI